nr:myosin-2 heavy chain-like [Nothobranchius furzeri]
MAHELNLTELKAKLDKSKANEILLTAKIIELTSEVKNFQKVLSEKETGWKNQLDDLTKKNTRFQREMRKEKSQRSNAALQLTERTAKLEETEKCLKSLKKEHQRLEKDLETQTSRRKSVETKLNSSVQTNTELKVQNEEFSKENEKLQALNESLLKNKEILQRSLAQEILRTTSLKKRLANFKAEYEDEDTVRKNVEVPLNNRIKELMDHNDRLKADAKKTSAYVTRLEKDKKNLLLDYRQLKRTNDEWPEKYFALTQENQKLATELDNMRILLDKNASEILNLNLQICNAVSKRIDAEQEKRKQSEAHESELNAIVEQKDSEIEEWKAREKLQLNEATLAKSLKAEYGSNLFKAQDQIQCLEQKISGLTDANALLSTEKESLVKATSSLSRQLKEVKMQLENTEQQLSSARNKDAQHSSILATKEMEKEQIIKELEITATELQNAKDEISDSAKKTQELISREKMEVQGKLDKLAEEFSKNGLKSVAMHVKTLLSGTYKKGQNKYTVGRLNLELESQNFMKKITEQKAEIEQLRGKLHKAMAAQSKNLLAKRRIIDPEGPSSSHELVIKLNNDKSFTGQRTNMVQLNKPCMFPSIGVEGRTVCGANLDDGFWMGVTEDAQSALPPP